MNTKTLAGEMTSKERVHAAAKGLPVDRIPVMYWLNPHATCKLISQFQPAKSIFWNLAGKYMWRRFSQSGQLEAVERLRAAPLLAFLYGVSEYALELGGDIANLQFGTNRFWGKMYKDQGRLRIKDAFGAVRGMCGIYLEVMEYPLKTPDDLKNYHFPDLSDEKHYARITKFRKAHPEACIIVDNFGVQDILSTWLMEMSQFMIALYRFPDEIKDFQRRLNEWQIEVARRCVKAGADLVFIYDDYGHERNTFLSPEMWKEFTFPHLKKKIEAVHDAGALAMLHSCGHQMPLLDYYVEAELDILQAFQPKAGNDFAKAYERVGDNLCFVTGIDIQRGETMSPEQLRQDILSFYEVYKQGARLILGTTHMMQPTMPDENIRAILETVRELQKN